MDCVSGCSIRFASHLLWSQATGAALLSAAVLSALPLRSAFRSDCTSVFDAWVASHFTLLASLTLPLALLHWLLAMDSSSAEAAVALVKKYKSFPAWSILLWAKTPARALKGLAYIITASLTGALYIKQFVRSSALQPAAANPAVPLALAWPFGFAASVIALRLQLDQAQFAGIQQSRAQRLITLAPTIASLTLAALLSGACLSAALYLLTPAPLPRALDCILAACAACSFVASVLASAHLTSLVLAERPNLRQLDSVDLEVVRCDFSTHS